MSVISYIKSGTIKANGINVYNYYGYINGITIDGGKINADTIFVNYKASQINVNGGRVQTGRFRCVSDPNPDDYSVHDKSMICYEGDCRYIENSTNIDGTGTEIKLFLGDGITKIHKGYSFN